MTTTEQTLGTKVENMLDSLRPFLQKDDGDIELVEIVSNVVKLRFLGTCSCCHMSTMTFKAGIEEAIKGIDSKIKSVEIIEN